MQMIVSGIIGNGDSKHACVLFLDGARSAEGQVPSCKISKNKGFNEDEVIRLEKYMKDNVYEIKAEAARMNNPLKAILRQ